MAMPNTRDLPHPALKKILYLVTGGLILTSVTGSHPQESILHPFLHPVLLSDCCSPNGHLEPFGAFGAFGAIQHSNRDSRSSNCCPINKGRYPGVMGVIRRSCGYTRFIRSYGSYKEVMRLHLSYKVKRS